MKRFGRIIRIAVVTAVACTGVALGIPAAFACTGTCSNGNTGVTASASVGEYITLTGLSPAINFGTLTAGVTSTVTGAEQETVATNDPAGYSLSVLPGSTGLMNGPATIGNSNIQIQETQGVAVPSTKYTFSGANPLVVDTEGAAISDTYNETWFLNAPSPLTSAAGSYSEGFTYLALAS